jgi:hypothetical protein
MRRVRPLMPAAVAASLLVLGSAPARAAKRNRRPIRGSIGYCDYRGSGYRCYRKDGRIRTRALPGWRYGPPGG